MKWNCLIHSTRAGLARSGLVGRSHQQSINHQLFLLHWRKVVDFLNCWIGEHPMRPLFFLIAGLWAGGPSAAEKFIPIDSINLHSFSLPANLSLPRRRQAAVISLSLINEINGWWSWNEVGQPEEKTHNQLPVNSNNSWIVWLKGRLLIPLHSTPFNQRKEK